MLVKVLGAFDVLSALFIFLNMQGWVSGYFVFLVFLYLFVKMVITFGDVLSMIDGLCGLIVLINLLWHVHWLNYAIIIYLLVKGGSSLF